MEMPDFTAYTQDGKAYTLSDMKGKVVVIDFWFTGCIPCRAEMPYFDRLAETFKDRPVQFLSVSVGYRRPIDGTVEKDGVGERREITCIEFESAREVSVPILRQE